MPARCDRCERPMSAQRYWQNHECDGCIAERKATEPVIVVWIEDEHRPGLMIPIQVKLQRLNLEE